MALTAGAMLFQGESRTESESVRVAWPVGAGLAADCPGLGWPAPAVQEPISAGSVLRAIWMRVVQLHQKHYEDASKLPPEYWFQGY